MVVSVTCEWWWWSSSSSSWMVSAGTVGSCATWVVGGTKKANSDFCSRNALVLGLSWKKIEGSSRGEVWCLSWRLERRKRMGRGRDEEGDRRCTETHKHADRPRETCDWFLLWTCMIEIGSQIKHLKISRSIVVRWCIFFCLYSVRGIVILFIIFWSTHGDLKKRKREFVYKLNRRGKKREGSECTILKAKRWIQTRGTK